MNTDSAVSPLQVKLSNRCIGHVFLQLIMKARKSGKLEILCMERRPLHE